MNVRDLKLAIACGHESDLKVFTYKNNYIDELGIEPPYANGYRIQF